MNPKYYGAAAEYNKPKGLFNFGNRAPLIAGIGLLGMLVVFVLIAVVGSLSGGSRVNLTQLISQQEQFRNTISTNTKNVKNSDLKRVGSEADLYLGSNIASLKKLTGNNDSTKTTQSDAQMSAELQNAAKAGKFDEVYLKLLLADVSSCIEIANSALAGAGQSSRVTLNRVNQNLGVIKERLSLVKL